MLIDAALEVPDAGFILFGEGGERPRLEALIRRHNLQNRFVLAGHIAALDRVLPNADLVVLPSHTEGLPNVALEASAAGVAVVATAVGGTPEVIADGVTGWLVPPANATALAERIRHLLDDDATRERFGAAGRKRMQSQFTFAAQAAQYRQLFEKVLGSRRLAA